MFTIYTNKQYPKGPVYDPKQKIISRNLNSILDYEYTQKRKRKYDSLADILIDF